MSNLNFKMIYRDSEPSLSDHRHIILMLKSRPKNTYPNNKKIVIDYTKIISNSFQSSINLASNFEELITICQNAILEATNEIIIPRKKIARKPFVTKNILELIKKKKRLFNFSKKFPNDTCLKILYLEARNKLSNKLRVSKSNYYNSLLDMYNNNLKKALGSHERNCLQ